MSIESKYTQGQHNGKVVAGLVLLIVGAVLLLQEVAGVLIPDWLTSWPIWVIGFGLYLGARHNFRRSGWIIFLIIGAVNLPEHIWPDYTFDNLTWPVIIIAIGIWMILGRRNREDKFEKYRGGNPFGKHDFTNPFDPRPKNDPNYDPNAPAADQPQSSTTPPYSHGDDYIDTVSVFGGTKRTVLSKSFKGGEIVNVFGGTDLDLTQADINGNVIIDITQLFGGIKLIIPPHWQVVSDVAAVFSSVDDKRRSMGVPLSQDKVLVIKGTSIFAGVDIRSF